MDIFFSVFLKIFFMMTPFFVLSVFLTVTSDATKIEKRTLAIKVTIAVIVMSLILMFFGKHIFAIFGLTLDAFRIGAGALLFLTAVELIHGSKDGQKVEAKNLNELAVVPLAIPVTIGPGTIGVLLVMGAEFNNTSDLITGSFALVCAIICIGIMLYLSSSIEKFIGKQGLLIISKITGLFLAALSAQIVFTGIKTFWAKMKILYFGGQKSGKSSAASFKALELAKNKAYYIATYDNSYKDESMNDRVNKHIEQRKNDFITIEKSKNLHEVVKKDETYIIDCISMWIFNNMHKSEEQLISELKKLFLIPCNIVFVLNDVSSGIIPLEKSTRKFVDLSGIIGQFLASSCEEVIEVKYGIQKRLK